VTEWGFINLEGMSRKGSWITAKPYLDMLMKQLHEKVKYPNSSRFQPSSPDFQTRVSDSKLFIPCVIYN